MFCVYVKLYATVERYLTPYVSNCPSIFEYQGVDAIKIITCKKCTYVRTMKRYYVHTYV